MKPRRSWAVGLMTVGLAVAPLGSLASWADDGGRTTFAAVPADEAGPDGRHWFELELDPGQQVVEHLQVNNLSGRTVTFGLVASDGYYTATGRFAMVPNPENATEAGTWIDIQPTVTVEARSTAVVPFTITVPNNAEPGDHAAAVAVGVAARAEAGDTGSGLAVTSRIGLKVMTRVSGEIDATLQIENTKATYGQLWNPIKPGSLTVGFDLVNTGNVRSTATGTVEVGGVSVTWPAVDEIKVELMPGEVRHVETHHDGVWPLFRVTATIQADPVAAPTTVAEIPDMAALEASAAALALPLPQLLTLLAIGLVVGSIMRGKRANKKRLQEAVADAEAAALLRAKAEAFAAKEREREERTQDRDAADA